MLSQWIRVVGFPMHPSISRSKFDHISTYVASLAPLGLGRVALMLMSVLGLILVHMYIRLISNIGKWKLANSVRLILYWDH